MSYKLKLIFSDGEEEILDDEFDSKSDAENEYEICLESWGAGRDVLKLAGREYDDSEIVDYEIWKE